MRFLQWNIWNREDADNILKTLREIDADVLCLQELMVHNPEYNHGMDVPGFLAAELGFDHVFAAASEEGEQKYGNGIFSRFPILASASHFIQDPPGPATDPDDYSQEGRIYVEASIEIGGRRITAGTTHMSYTDRLAITQAKKAETDRLVSILQGKKQDFFFSGDLNALPDSYTVNEISKVLTDCGPTMDEKTWTTKPFSYLGFEVNALDWRLDYCFATPDMAVKSAQVIKTDYSDHLPLLVEF